MCASNLFFGHGKLDLFNGKLSSFEIWIYHENDFLVLEIVSMIFLSLLPIFIKNSKVKKHKTKLNLKFSQSQHQLFKIHKMSRGLGWTKCPFFKTGVFTVTSVNFLISEKSWF